MIRFSAGLVVVAIGVLIGGVATSKLSLVYIAIAVSAVALVVLAIGVALKRDELFGGGPESAPAQAGADSGMPAGQMAGASDDRGSAGHVREDRKPVQKKVPGPATAAFEAAAAAQAAAVAAPAVAAPTMTSPTVASPAGSPAGDKSPFGNPPLAHRRTAVGQPPAPEADAAADWQARSPQPAWSSGDETRPSWTPRAQTPTASSPTASSPTVPQSGAASVPPRGWGNPDQSPGPAAKAGSGTVAPSWFDRLNQPSAGPVTPTGNDPATAGPEKAEPADVSDTDDDDWPTRYSWLDDDETDEAAEDDKTDVSGNATDVTDAAVPETVSAETVAAETVAAPTLSARAEPEGAKAAEPAPADADSPDAAAPDPDPDLDADDHPVTADDEETTAEPPETPAVDAAHEDEPPAPQHNGAKLVTVIPGVPRYHDPDCILIRFMDDEDVARKSIPEAKAANCTPCAACQPEG